MTTTIASYLDAISHLPAGGTLILSDVPWREYEQLLADLGEGYAVRISYNNGRLEVMSPSLRHEKYKEFVLGLARVLSDELGIVIETCGSTTFKNEQLGGGAEPDTCLYIQNASCIIGKDRIDLATDPPPDIVVEIDVSHESKTKFGFYASIGVPELWRYDERRAEIYQLTDRDYAQVPASVALPLVTADLLSQFLEQSRVIGQTAALQAFRDWLRRQRS